MKIPQPIVMTASAGVSTIAGAYLQQSLEIMVPWLIVTFAVIVADLAAGMHRCIFILYGRAVSLQKK